MEILLSLSENPQNCAESLRSLPEDFQRWAESQGWAESLMLFLSLEALAMKMRVVDLRERSCVATVKKRQDVPFACNFLRNLLWEVA